MMCQGEFTSTLMHVDGLQTKRSFLWWEEPPALQFCTFCLCLHRPEWSQKLNYYRVEASWKLGQWDGLETYLKAVRLFNHTTGLGLQAILLCKAYICVYFS